MYILRYLFAGFARASINTASWNTGIWCWRKHSWRCHDMKTLSALFALQFHDWKMRLIHMFRSLRWEWLYFDLTFIEFQKGRLFILSIDNKPALVQLKLISPKCRIYASVNRLVTYSATRHYLNQRRVIVNCTLKNKLQWNLNRNTKLFIHENAFENVVCEMTAILSRGEIS